MKSEDYNKILNEFLNLQEVKEYMNENRENYPDITEYDLITDAIDYFFTDEIETALKINEVFEIAAGYIRDEADRITMDYEHLIEYLDTSIEDMVNAALELVKWKLEDIVKEKYGEG
jgi:hypothetical protein